MSLAKRSVLTILTLLLLLVVALVIRALTYPMLKVTTNDESATMSGYNLFAPTVDDLGYELDRSNHIYLSDMEGNVIHRWDVLGSVRLVRLKPDGNLLYSTRDRSFRRRSGIREIDPFGNVLWYYSCSVDHDFHPYEDGSILVHTTEEVSAPDIAPGRIICPRLTVVTAQKDTIWEWKAEDHLAELTEQVGITFPLDREGIKLHDWAHNNSCQVIDENEASARDPRFKPGNILFSYCNLNTIGVISRDSGEIVWAWGPGVLDGQHNPTMLHNGHLLIFDNGTDRGYSRVLELDPITEEIVWEYNDKDARKPRFYSAYLSSAQLLPNNNVFVGQGGFNRGYDPVYFFRRELAKLLGKSAMSARLFEVTQSGDIVWDCTITLDGRYMDGLYQATRYTYAEVSPLLEAIESLEGEETRRLHSLPYIR